MRGSYGTRTIIGGNYGTVDDLVNYVARLAGTQYWQLSAPISLQMGDIISFGVLGFQNTGTFKRFFGSNDFTFSLDTGGDGDKFRLKSVLSATINGVPIISDLTLIPEAGLNSVSLEVGTTTAIETLLSLGSSNLLKAAIYDFKVVRGDIVIHEIPLTNEAQGATQLATAGNVNATMVGYIPDVWEQY